MGIGREALNARLQLLQQDGGWDILDKLVNTKEPQLRRLLRPHAESEFSPEDKDEMEQRRQLDAALGALTWLEIAYQAGLANKDELPPPKSESLKKLFKSEAFLRYVDVYLYFGIRFLAGRIDPPLWLFHPEAIGQTSPEESNIRTLALFPAPPVPPFKGSEEYFAALIQQAQRTDPALFPPGGPKDVQVEALEFLDGFSLEESECSGQTNEVQDYELWLRGLLPSAQTKEEEEQKARFERLSLGLTTFALTRRDFYISLDLLASEKLHYRESHCTPDQRRLMRPPGGWALGKPFRPGERLPEKARLSFPLAMRLGLSDIYWISKLLKADVSATGSVSYKGQNWLHLLRFQAGLLRQENLEEQLWTAEEILRSIFDKACDLVQNAVELTAAQERRAFEPDLFIPRQERSWDWPQAFDEELEEIERQRRLRQFKETQTKPEDPTKKCEPHYWKESVRTGARPFDLVGLAFSGGGIRSATFNLGVLQGLQEFDVLSNIDYLSTVSGGGFVGSWLVANVNNTKHWLGRLTDWGDSIAHLRRYSKYLAPQSSVLSADVWTMWGTWLRNAFLIQITAAAWLLVLLLATLVGGHVFGRVGKWPFLIESSIHWGAFVYGYRIPISAALAVAFTVWVLLALIFNLSGDRASSAAPRPVSVNWFQRLAAWIHGKGEKYGWNWLRQLGMWLYYGVGLPSRWVRRLAVLPACVAAFLLASLMWADATGQSALTVYWNHRDEGLFVLHDYSKILLAEAWKPWLWFLIFEVLSLTWIAFLTLSYYRAQSDKLSSLVWRFLRSVLISILSTAALYLQLCAILWIFLDWSASPRAHHWYAYVFGPPLVLQAHIISVALFVGFCGRRSKEAIREWWTRFGTWLLIYAALYLALALCAVFAPLWMMKATTAGGPWLKTLKWGGVITWVGTVISGLLAGKSSKTSGDRRTSSKGLELLAKVGGLVFIIGAVFIAATVLYIVLVNVGTTQDWRCYSNLLPGLRDYGDSACYWYVLSKISGSTEAVAWLVVLGCGVLFSYFFEINIFGLNQFYRARLVRCYLGATRWAPGIRKPQPFTNFDDRDDMRLSHLRTYAKSDDAPGFFRGPFPIFNCALNLAGSSDLTVHTRHSASFTLTPLRCGNDRARVGYAPTRQANEARRQVEDRRAHAEANKWFADGVMLGQAVAISGAAASPNMGYNTSPLVAFLLTMFNVRLGWWFPNPGKRGWSRSGLGAFSLYYLVKELLGIADEKSWHVNVSDGGHFENLGIYELVRRRCKVIIASDGECDEALQFGSLGNVVRMCETDFGAKIDIDVSSIRPQKNGLSLAHCSIGRITYSNGSLGYLIYLKASITGDEDVGVAQYRSVHPSFPHETTADQFFTEDQFEAYRRLGRHVVEHSLRGTQPGDHPVAIAERLADVLAPAGCASEVFLKHATALDGLWERFRRSPRLQPFLKQLMRQDLVSKTPALRARDEEFIMGLELIQLMENVFLDLRLDDFWEHPDNRGWAILFMRWARSQRFREIWATTRRTFGIRFEYFCQARLGLRRDDPVVRV